MARTVNIPTRNWTTRRYERTIDTVPADATGVQIEFDMAEWPARYYPDPLGPLAQWEIAYSADGVEFEVIGFGELWNVLNPRNGSTLIRVASFFPTDANLSNVRRNPNQVRGALTVYDTTIRTPVRMQWLNTQAMRA